MSSGNWQHKFDMAVRNSAHDVTVLANDAARFVQSLSRMEQAMLCGLAVLMLFYMLLPGGRGEAASTSTGRSFTGILILFLVTGLGAGWMASGRITI
ncbi:MAG: hypothetical protein ACK4MQ_11715 [Hyphomonas sp.]